MTEYNLAMTVTALGTNDLFHHEDVTWAQRLRAAGTPCVLHIIEGAYHGFDLAEPRAAVSRDFLRARMRALRAMVIEGTEPAGS
jgi:acetyl esterase/lipase